MSTTIKDLHLQAFWICVAITAVVFAAMIYSLIKFRRSQAAMQNALMLQSTRVDVIWTVVPALILVAVAIPAAERILKPQDLRVPSGTEVRLLTSEDVIHSWYAPHPGLQRSAVPDLVKELWFEADSDREGIYRGQCAALELTAATPADSRTAQVLN